ncbi:MAG: hypothetical protein MJK18_06555, partial [Bdellovibrionales bacterium]|nr:hypothetical protein [Bdellovibrionales bacterium]
DAEADVADHMRRQALAMISVGFDVKKTDPQEVKVESRSRPILKWINWLGLFFSSFCVFAGLATPGARNLVGLGASFLVLFIALLIYRKR